MRLILIMIIILIGTAPTRASARTISAELIYPRASAKVEYLN